MSFITAEESRCQWAIREGGAVFSNNMEEGIGRHRFVL